MTLVSASTGWILGWTLFHSLWQGALVAGGLALFFRLVPGSRARLRSAAAWCALLLLVGLGVTTWALVDTEWRGHVACWESEAFAVENPALCASHAVPAAREALGDASKSDEVMPLSWIRRLALPVPLTVRAMSLEATGLVAGLALLWGTFVAAALLRLAVGLRLVGRILRRSRPMRGDALEGLQRRLKMDFQTPGARVLIRESPDLSTPAVAGWRRPVILVPSGMPEALGPDRLADVLAHELVHVRERHFVVNLGQRALDCLCVVNPFALWISRRIREEREVHCDRVASDHPAGGRRRYVETLIELEHLRSPGSPALVGLVGEGGLLRRIRRLSESTEAPRRGRIRRGALAAAVAVATIGIVVHASMTVVALTSWSVMSHDIAQRTSQTEALGR